MKIFKTAKEYIAWIDEQSDESWSNDTDQIAEIMEDYAKMKLTLKDTWNREDLLGNGEGSLDEFLLNNEKITQEERELIMEIMYDYLN